MNATRRESTSRSPMGLIVEHLDASGQRVVVVRGDLRVVGEIQGHGHSHAEEVEQRISALEAKLAALTSPHG
jgi:BMFP domain-containing protein YqiC